MLRYTATLLSVKDMERAKDFYREALGLAVTADFGANVTVGGVLSLQTEDSWAGLLHTDTQHIIYDNLATELYFETDDIDGFAAQLDSRGLTPFQPLAEQSWGQRCLRLRDPDGHVIEVGESLAQVMRRFAAAGLTPEQIAARMDVPTDLMTASLK